MNSFLKKHHRFLFFSGWLLINIIQAATTELFDDEAYYWVYSRYPAWGYFDHPPIIAILIRAGYSIIQNELGVRLLIVLMNTGTILLISKLIERRNDRLFYCIMASIAIAQIGGMIAVPDVPLLFFVTLFFLSYRKFIEQMNLRNSLLLGITIVLMVYTKYHGILIVIFTLLSNLKLFTRHQTYLVTGIALLLYAPHLYWQYLHGFPSIQFHLFERSAGPYQLNHTTDYILSQLGLAGPIVGWLLIWGSFKYRPATTTEKALKFTLIGFYLFFLFSTLRGRVEANWTVPSFVALITLSHQYLNSRKQTHKWFYKTVPVTLLLVIAVRSYMMLDLKASDKIGKDEFHQNKSWVNTIVKKANGRPVVFLDSYQRPSKYWFYSGQRSLGMNTPDYRRNNYNFWPVEDFYFGKSVCVVGKYDPFILNDTIVAPRFRGAGSSNMPYYYSFMKAQFTHVYNEISSNNIKSSFNVQIPESYLIFFQTYPCDTASIQLAILNIRDTIRYYSSSVTVRQITQRSSNLSVNFFVRLPKGLYDARLGISSAVPGHPTLNSPSFRIKID